MRHATILIAILAFVPLTSTTAQERPPVKPGAQIRVTAPSALVVGTVVSWESGQLVVDALRGTRTGTLTFPVDSIIKLDIRRRGSAWGKGAKIGGALGGVLGTVGLIALVSTFCLFDCPADPTGGELLSAAVLGAVGGGLAGGVLGALIAAPFPNPSWQTVYRAQPTVKVSVGKARDGGFGLGASVRF